MIAAMDKDWPPAFRKLCHFATKEAFTTFAEAGDLPKLYEAGELDKIESLIDDMGDDFLESVFETDSRITKEAWIENTAARGAYLFSAKELRERILTRAGIPYRY
jgi:hypothetical protein